MSMTKHSLSIPVSYTSRNTSGYGFLFIPFRVSLAICTERKTCTGIRVQNYVIAKVMPDN